MAANHPVQIEYTNALRKGRTEADVAYARKTDAATHRRLNELRAEPCNSECFDCTATKPGWAVLPFGVYVCIDCAQVHRGLGRHVSQVKAINTGTYLWLAHEAAVMEGIGNRAATAAFASCGLPPKPSRDAPAADKLAYAQAKYVRAKPDWRDATAAKEKPPAAPAKPAPAKPASKPASLSAPQVIDLISFDDEALCASAPAAPPQDPFAASERAFFAQFGL